MLVNNHLIFEFFYYLNPQDIASVSSLRDANGKGLKIKENYHQWEYASDI